MPRCKICRDKFEARYFLQKACLNPACLAEWSKLDREKKADDKHKARKREFKDNDKSLRTKEAQKAFNAFIRARDNNLPCVSCGRHHIGQYHAGHYKSTGSSPELRFEELNNNKQCAPCNNHLSGNIGEYRPNLESRIGKERFLALRLTEIKRYECSELKEIEVLYKKKLKELSDD